MLKNLFPKKNKTNVQKAQLESVSKAFKGKFSDGELQWQWDGRFDAVMAEFDAKHQEKVLSVLGGHFSDYWYNACITEAPMSVQEINESLGGLKPGQLFFSTNTEKEHFTYCAWWPWNMGKTISIRLALSPGSLSLEDKAEYIEACKRWFDIQPTNQWGSI